MKNLLLCLLALTVAVPAWAGSTSWVGVDIELKGPPESVSVLVANLKKQKVFKAASCEISNESKISCAMADSRLMAFLGKNASVTTQWSISSSPIQNKCVPGCRTMRCPPPNGPMTCCNVFTLQVCP